MNHFYPGTWPTCIFRCLQMQLQQEKLSEAEQRRKLQLAEESKRQPRHDRRPLALLRRIAAGARA